MSLFIPSYSYSRATQGPSQADGIPCGNVRPLTVILTLTLTIKLFWRTQFRLTNSFAPYKSLVLCAYRSESLFITVYSRKNSLKTIYIISQK